MSLALDIILLVCLVLTNILDILHARALSKRLDLLQLRLTAVENLANGLARESFQGQLTESGWFTHGSKPVNGMDGIVVRPWFVTRGKR